MACSTLCSCTYDSWCVHAGGRLRSWAGACGCTGMSRSRRRRCGPSRWSSLAYICTNLPRQGMHAFIHLHCLQRGPGGSPACLHAWPSAAGSCAVTTIPLCCAWLPEDPASLQVVYLIAAWLLLHLASDTQHWGCCCRSVWAAVSIALPVQTRTVLYGVCGMVPPSQAMMSLQHASW